MSHNEARDQRRGGRGTVEARRRRQMRPTVLALEPRALLSSTYFHPPTTMGRMAGSSINFMASTGGTIVVKEGNGNGDSVSINSKAQKIVVVMGNGNNDKVSITSNANIEVIIGNGTDDSVTIDETGTGTVTVTTGSGSGTVSIQTTGPTPNVSLGSSSWSSTVTT